MSPKRFVGLLVMVIASYSATVSAIPETLRVETRMKAPFGAYLTDSRGMALYILEQDRSLESTCFAECARAWPPLLSQSTEIFAGQGVTSALLQVFQREKGSLQAAYNSRPLYLFVKDRASGDTTGQGVTDRWGTWFLIAPDGNIIR